MNKGRNNFFEKLRNSDKFLCIFYIPVGSKVVGITAKGSELAN